MDGLRNRLFPKIDEQQFRLQREQIQKEQASYVVSELRKNHTSSLYNLTHQITPKRNLSQFRKPKQKLIMPTYNQPTLQLSRPHNLSIRETSPHVTPPKFEQNISDCIKFQKRSNLKSSVRSKILKIKTELMEQIREQRKDKSMLYPEQSLGSLLNVQRLKEIEDVQTPKRHEQRREIIRKGAGRVANKLEQKNERRGILKITSIKGWVTEEDQNRLFN